MAGTLSCTMAALRWQRIRPLGDHSIGSLERIRGSHRRTRTLSYAAETMATILCALLVVAACVRPHLSAAPTSAAPIMAAQAAQASPGDFASAVRQVANQVRPAVVQITNLQQQINPFVGVTGTTVPAGVGSGVIYDSQGHILTNKHVVAGSQQLQVSLPDKRSFPATLVGADPQTDLAVVQIQADNLPVAQLGDSSQLQVGDWVVAIGNALALPGGPTVTQGVVSALGRTVQEPGESPGASGPFLFNAIQTDAPINPGNSGGALVNLQGGRVEPPAESVGQRVPLTACELPEALPVDTNPVEIVPWLRLLGAHVRVPQAHQVLDEDVRPRVLIGIARIVSHFGQPVWAAARASVLQRRPEHGEFGARAALQLWIDSASGKRRARRSQLLCLPQHHRALARECLEQGDVGAVLGAPGERPEPQPPALAVGTGPSRSGGAAGVCRH